MIGYAPISSSERRFSRSFRSSRSSSEWSCSDRIPDVICKNPFVTVGSAFPCGTCVPCRINRARVWKHRLLIEGYCHSDSTFVTLTYDEDHLPKDGSLKPKEVQDWLKRLRFRCDAGKLRFYLCGEYGTKTWRPHYHVILFGYPSCKLGKTKRDFVSNRSVAFQCCASCREIYDSWGMGDIELGEFNSATAGYVSDYVVKNITRKDDFKLRGRYPEFSRMSNRPGIGALGVVAIAKVLRELDGALKDVPISLMHGTSRLPLGRYMRIKLREALGRDGRCPDELLLEYQEAMRELRESAKDSEENPSFKAHLMAKFAGAVVNVEAKQLLFGAKKRGVL